ncbi:MAG: CoA transferase [Deltaproteobacteria bacterium]|nr:CoA transferase [Deltaproteobacteria bacterium]MBW2723875.1 CoA transferase [Deltaproteobacteria bacterium]
MAEALEGIRVIELGGGVSAPYCAKLFADYGADVVKIEAPGTGDRSRSWGPFPSDEPDREKSGLFHCLNTNKKSVTLDANDSGDREKIRSLISGADVLIENNTPAQMREWSLDYATLRDLNPRLVMISITPFGQTGPYADWKATDLNAFHISGASSRYCGRPDEAPLEHGTFAADYFGAVAAAAWGLAAVYGRTNTGVGQQVDVSCAEVIAATFVGGQNIGGYAQDGKFERRTGVGMPLGAPATIVPCKDGHVWMLALEPGQWNGIAKVMGDPEWMQTEMFQDMFSRAENADLIYPLIEEWTMKHGKHEIMERCQAEGAPVSAVFTVAEAVEHPHLREREYIVELEHAALGRVRMLGAPFKLSQSPGGPKRAAPLLGADNDAILGALALQPPSEEVKATEGARPLEGIRVANFGWVWAGPVVGQTLNFLGAEVYKVESNVRVDMTRTLPPFGGGEAGPNRSLSNHACWAGNGSVTIDFKTDEGLELARQLIMESDVVIENFGPGVMEKIGLGYEEMKKRKPELVMLSMQGAGAYGPLMNTRTYGLSLTSLTGLDSLTGYCDGPPLPVENAYSDPFTGIFGAFALVAALTYRDRTGQGQYIDFSQQEAVMQMVGPAFMDYVMNDRVAGPLGNRHPLAAAAPHGVFRCRGDDRWISIAVEDEASWKSLVAAMGNPDWADTPEFASLAARLSNIEMLHEQIDRWTAEFDDRELAARLQEAGVAAAPVLNVADLLDDPHFRARNTFIEVDHPLGFRETIYGSYVKLSHSPVTVRPGPVIGQDNEHVFKNILGLSDERYSELVEQKIIY